MGYMGLQMLCGKTTMPKNRARRSHEQARQQGNRLISSKDRVPAEHVIARTKRFKIVSDQYRNCIKRFGLRFTLIAACYNRDIAL